MDTKIYKEDDEVYALTKPFTLISKEGKKIIIDKKYLNEFKYFQRIFEDEPTLQELKFEEETFAQLKALFDCMYTNDFSSHDLHDITYLLVKWMYEGNFHYIDTLYVEDLENIYSGSESNFSLQIKNLLQMQSNRTSLKKLKLSPSMKIFLFGVLVSLNI